MEVSRYQAVVQLVDLWQDGEEIETEENSLSNPEESTENSS